MRRRRKNALIIIAGLLAIAAAVGGYVLYAMNRVQPFYAKAMQADPQELKSAGRRMEQRVENLREEAEQVGRWESVFTDDEVNGWLALYLEENHDKFLPPEVAEPRVALVDGGIKVGFRYLGKRLDAVISIEADAFMMASDVAAVRLRKAHLGALPLAMSEVVDEIRKGAEALGLPIRWTTEGEDPVMLLAVSDALSTDEEFRQLEQLELRDGEVLLAGRTERRSAREAVRPVQAGGR